MPWSDYSGPCPLSCEYLQQRRFHHLLEQPLPRKKKKSVFLYFSGVGSFSVYAHCFLSCHEAPLTRDWLSHQVFIHVGQTSLTLLCSRLISPMSLDLFSYEVLRLFNPCGLPRPCFSTFLILLCQH